MLRSQSGPVASILFTCSIARHTTFDAWIFRTLLLRRLCSLCPRPAVFAGVPSIRFLSTTVQHVLWWSRKQVEGSPPTVASGTWMLSRRTSWMNVTSKFSMTACFCSTECRWPWAQRWSFALRRDGTPRPLCVDVDGAALEVARRRKDFHHPELSGRQGRTRLVTPMRVVEKVEVFVRLSLLDCRAGLNFDGAIPSTSDVVGDWGCDEGMAVV